MRPVVLEAAEGVRGLLHLPGAGVPGSGVGVVLVGPVGWDDQGSYRPRKVWAQALADAGHAALRIDLPGTGDSGGGPRDPDRLGAWTAAVTEAARWLREEAGAARVALVGMAAGGAVGLHAVAEGAAIEDVVLWGVPARGRSLVRELKAFGRLEASQTGEDPAAWPEGELRGGGFLVAAETVAALGALALPEAGASPSRALLLGRDGAGPDEGLRAGLEAGGAAVETDPGHGWGATVAPPQQAVPPEAVIARVGAFLAAAAPGGGFREPASGALRLDGVRERTLSFEVDGVAMVGVLAEPVDGPGAEGVVVLLNAGAIRRIGPNRLWVEAARRCAAAGVPALRLDVEGIGDAGGDASPYASDEALYIPRLTRQVVESLDVLAAEGLSPRFLLTGLCSGAYWSLHAALEDERVRTAVLLNPRVVFWDSEAAPRYELHRALRVFSRDGLRRLRTASHPVRRLGSLLRWLVTSTMRMPGRRLGRRASRPTDTLYDELQRLQQRGQRVIFAFAGGDEPLRDELDRENAWGQLEALGVARHPLPMIDHTLKGLEAQAAALDLLDRAVRETFGVPVGAPEGDKLDG